MRMFIKVSRFVSKELFLNRCLPPCLIMNSERHNSVQSFKYDQIVIKQSKKPQQIPDLSTLIFGKTFSDHMLLIEWTESQGWSAPQIAPLHHFQMHPGSKVFHYAQAAFEGMKAYRQPDSKISLFRPELNMKRLLGSAQRVSLPAFDCDELLKCVKKLVSIDYKWVPEDKSSSLYIRPTFIGTEECLGVSASKTALLYVITCPVGPYFKTGVTRPVSLLANPNFVRAWPGGSGHCKLAANYAPTLHVQKLAHEQGLDQVLWLTGKDYQISEAGAMNVFFFLKKSNGLLELVTPPLDGTILPGVTRQSILDLSKEWKEFEVSERNITMSELIQLNNEKRLLEMFICGTACILCPVNLIRFKNEDIKIPTTNRENSLYLRVLKVITDIQYGRIISEWLLPVD